LPEKAPSATDLRGSARPPRVTHRSTDLKIKVHRPNAKRRAIVLLRGVVREQETLGGHLTVAPRTVHLVSWP
jgi:hypothetical protein